MCHGHGEYGRRKAEREERRGDVRMYEDVRQKRCHVARESATLPVNAPRAVQVAANTEYEIVSGCFPSLTPRKGEALAEKRGMMEDQLALHMKERGNITAERKKVRFLKCISCYSLL
ncbi:hypothetical protein NDU88_005787 [Pleurodeles waltl]|uniref:Uncharacterized protein n=1 Tax=Pleurodeles waltl TaxID=8319 RepID=A0AAV7VNX4_PLEWA|nr:hypothetical protein NDU88_005787 [Pleurodeles waltl]